LTVEAADDIFKRIDNGGEDAAADLAICAVIDNYNDRCLKGMYSFEY